MNDSAVRAAAQVVVQIRALRHFFQKLSQPATGFARAAANCNSPSLSALCAAAALRRCFLRLRLRTAPVSGEKSTPNE